MKKWTYKKMKENKTIEVYIVNEDTTIQKIEGTIGEEFNEDVPEWNIEKGDFWISCPSLNNKILGKLNYIMNNYDKPCVFFQFNHYKHHTGLKQTIKSDLSPPIKWRGFSDTKSDLPRHAQNE